MCIVTLVPTFLAMTFRSSVLRVRVRLFAV